MRNHTLTTHFSLKYDPFRPAIPPENLWEAPGADTFFRRTESLVGDGGFAMICGEPGLGKSKALQLLARRLGQFDDVTVGIIERPQSSLSDFYRELGSVFGVPLSVANRYGGFQALRDRWREHIKETLFRPVLLVDEAQQVQTECLNELRLLGSDDFDSNCLLTTVLCGDTRLLDRFRTPELLPLGSRIATRLQMTSLSVDALGDFLNHALDKAGGPHLMKEALKNALVEHAAGNLRLLCNMCHTLLVEGCRRDASTLDEQLFFEVFDHRQP